MTLIRLEADRTIDAPGGNTLGIIANNAARQAYGDDAVEGSDDAPPAIWSLKVDGIVFPPDTATNTVGLDRDDVIVELVDVSGHEWVGEAIEGEREGVEVDLEETGALVEGSDETVADLLDDDDLDDDVED